MSDTLLEQIKADRENGTPGPWAYRPQKYDDWGVVRISSPDADGFHMFICQVKSPCVSDAIMHDHRRKGTDPWEHDARRIARVPDLEAAYIALTEARARDAETIKAAEKLAALLADVPWALSGSFAAGTEEREGGSGRRQDKFLETSHRLRREIPEALAVFYAAQEKNDEHL